MDEMFERWPGYNEQSWVERFAELDRRYGQLRTSFSAALTACANASRPPIDREWAKAQARKEALP